MFETLLDKLQKAGMEIDAVELAEALWIAQRAPRTARAGTRERVGRQTPADEPQRRKKVAPTPEAATDADPESRAMTAYDKSQAGDEGIPATEFLLPAAAPLSQASAAAIGRALRPLARRRPSNRERVFDEAATANASGETGFATPVFRPASERWFSVAVVMEETASMTVWQELAEELERLFARHGGFNGATRWRLRFERDGEWLIGPRARQPIDHLHRLGERQLILLLTDGSSSRWEDGRMSAVLHRWGRVCPVVLAQVVPERAWSHTRLGVPSALIRAHQPGGRNSDLSQTPRSEWSRPPKDGLPFPVVALDPDLIAEWAAMLMHPGIHFTAVPIAPPQKTEKKKTGAARSAPRAPSPRERLDLFRRRVSPDAFTLAILLSFMPLTLPVMRTVQAARLRDASPSLLSELLLGGLLRRLDPGAPIDDPDTLRFDFHDGLRELLNPLIARDEIVSLFHLIADHISRLTGERYTISALIPYLKGEKRLPHADARPFAQFFRDGLRRIGWRHVLPFDEINLDAPRRDGPALAPFSFETILLDATGRELERRSLQARQFVEPLADDLVLEMVEVPGGSFLMGTNKKDVAKEKKEIARYYKEGADWIDWELPQHEVRVPDFYIGKYPITQRQWRVIAEDASLKVDRDLDPNPSRFKGKDDSDDRPVEQVSWEDVKEFCARLTKKTGREYRLPTEAEWEYACRAGTTTPFAFGETITPEVVNYDGKSPYAKAKKGNNRNETIPVGILGVANAFGLYDMHGNVWEWCEDVWHSNYEGAPADGSAWLSGGDSRHRVLRGGSWGIRSIYCRSAVRSLNDPDVRSISYGVRVAVARVP
ncbi:MAG: formylglycine-generating enzyme family protein [Blastocatellia bacterium]|nr:formylglycine-generating enzyme family protein [Blastocatellia bacterium]